MTTPTSAAQPDPAPSDAEIDAEIDAMMLAGGWRKSADGKHYECDAVAPPDPAPPSDAEVEHLLDLFGVLCRCTQSFACSPCKVRKELRTHIAALRSENAALVVERDDARRRLREVLHNLGDVMERRDALAAERDALRGRLLRLAARWEEYADTLRGGPEAREVEGCAGELRREIARLESLLAGEGAE